MVEIIWTEPALAELDAIADYIALDKPEAARRCVATVFTKVENLSTFPEMGSKIPEWRESLYRQLVIPPCRIFYRFDGHTIFIIFVMRGEREFQQGFLVETPSNE